MSELRIPDLQIIYDEPQYIDPYGHVVIPQPVLSNTPDPIPGLGFYLEYMSTSAGLHLYRLAAFKTFAAGSEWEIASFTSQNGTNANPSVFAANYGEQAHAKWPNEVVQYIVVEVTSTQVLMNTHLVCRATLKGQPYQTSLSPKQAPDGITRQLIRKATLGTVYTI